MNAARKIIPVSLLTGFLGAGKTTLRGADHRAIFHGVHNRFHLFRDRPWRPDETRRSQFVFVGQQLDAA